MLIRVRAIETRTKIRGRIQTQIYPRQDVGGSQTVCGEPQRLEEGGMRKTKEKENIVSGHVTPPHPLLGLGYNACTRLSPSHSAEKILSKVTENETAPHASVCNHTAAASTMRLMMFRWPYPSTCSYLAKASLR
jgi:hypothetical protein